MGIQEIIQTFYYVGFSLEHEPAMSPCSKEG